MKKIFPSVFAFLFIFSNSMIFAQMPVAAPAMVPIGLEKVGVIAAAKGKVELVAPGQVGRIAESGQAIFLGDEVKTDSEGHLQILLLDQTVFTIGPNSAIVIDKFVYDPKTSDGQIQASITKGVFRYVSGKIAAKKSDNISVKLPTAVIGFRGTIVGGAVNLDGSSLTALLGPGDNNDARETVGSFVMSGVGGNADQSRLVNRTGFGVEAGANGVLSNVFQVPGINILHLATGLLALQGQPRSRNDLTDGRSVTNLSGEGRAATGRMGARALRSIWNFNRNSEETTLASQDAANAAGGAGNQITRMWELGRIPSNQIYSFSGSGIFSQTKLNGDTSTTYPGTMSASWSINFNQRRLENVNVTVESLTGSGSINSTATLGDVPFAAIPPNGLAVFNPPRDLPSNPNVTARITLFNGNNQIAQSGEIQAEYRDIVGGGNEGMGSFTTGHS